MDELAFGCLAAPGAQARHALLLAQSLRAFGGGYAGSPMLALIPPGEPIDPAIASQMKSLEVQPVGYALDPALGAVPLAERAAGAAQAEATAEGMACMLVWLDSDSLILREPAGLKIGEGARIGCRPVDLTLIGSPWEEAPDAYWEMIFAGCGVDRNAIFPVRTTVEGQAIRAYFNAGCLVVRPEVGLLLHWRDAIVRLAEAAAFVGLSGRQRLFFHQAVLAGTVLAAARQEEITELPPSVSFPLHLHDRVPPERRPASLREVETCRYESVFDLEDWTSRVPVVDADLRSWLEARRDLARSG
jgi:hypothetical protein